MTKVGYARVSTTDQDLDLQLTALKAAGCDVIRSEKVSGTSTQGRAELRTLLDFIRKGDVLTVTRIDRLARSIADLAVIVRELEVQRRGAQGDRAANRHQLGGRSSLLANAWRFR